MSPLTTSRARRMTLIVGIASIAIVIALGVITSNRQIPLVLDSEWMEEIIEHRGVIWLVPSLVMNFLGGGWFGTIVVPIAVTATLILVRRPWAAVYFLTATVVSAALVQALKALFGRARPVDILVNVDPGSFPSGHVANAATMAVALAVILARTWVWFAGAAYVLVMALSRTYLGAHWVTDTLGGALLGAAVALLLAVAFAPRLGDASWRRTPRRASVEA